jgi:hypothetical protein
MSSKIEISDGRTDALLSSTPYLSSMMPTISKERSAAENFGYPVEIHDDRDSQYSSFILGNS